MQHSLCHNSLNQRKVNGRSRAILSRPPGDEMEESDKHILIRGIHDFLDVCIYLSWKRLLRESALRHKYRSETNCAEIVRCDSINRFTNTNWRYRE